MENVQIDYLDIEENKEYETLIKKVIDECFKTEDMNGTNLYVSITLTTPKNIKELNNKYRNINEETDVLSFPMFEKSEINEIKNIEHEEALGDIVVSVDRVMKQAVEYGHSFERELAYMIVHGFYHLMGEDHVEEEDKKIMRQKEEFVLNNLKIVRN